MKFLLTGARAPVTLDLARNITSYGHTVFAVDSFRFPVTRRSKNIQKYIRIAKPNIDLKQYEIDLINVINNYKIDMLIPTCEDIFFIAYLKPTLEIYCTVFCDDFELLKSFHSKFDSLLLSSSCGINIPKTNILSSLQDVDQFKNYVIKKEFTRFGTDIWFSPSEKELTQILQDNTCRYIIQQKITGEEFCTYSIARQGQLLAHVTYRPLYRLKHSASMYFEPVAHPKIANFVTKFIKKHNFTGQIAFDIIQENEDIYLLECNPRCSSGIHLLYQNNLAAVFQGKTLKSVTTIPAKLSYAMWLSSFLISCFQGNLKRWITDYKRAREVIYVKDDKSILFYQLLTFGELIYYMISQRKSFRRISTFDIAFSGKIIHHDYR